MTQYEQLRIKCEIVKMTVRVIELELKYSDMTPQRKMKLVSEVMDTVTQVSNEINGANSNAQTK